MGIQLTTNFDMSGTTFLDSREEWDSIEALRANTTIKFPEGFIARVKDTKKRYIMNCTNVDTISTYIWTEYNTGSGTPTNALATLTLNSFRTITTLTAEQVSALRGAIEADLDANRILVSPLYLKATESGSVTSYYCIPCKLKVNLNVDGITTEFDLSFVYDNDNYTIHLGTTDGTVTRQGDSSSWNGITNKPFEYVGTNGLVIDANSMDVDFTKVQSILGDATTTESGKMSLVDKIKLNSIQDNANNYTLPIASSDGLGGVKVGANLTINDSTGVLSATDTTYEKATALSDGLLSKEDFSKLATVASNSEENTISEIKINGTTETPVSKVVDIAIPTKTSDIVNDSDFVVDADYVHTDNNYTTVDVGKVAKIGDFTTITVTSVDDLVSAINKLDASFMSSMAYSNKALVLTYKNGATYSVDVSSIITDTNIDELKNVSINTATLADNQHFMYDIASERWINKTDDTLDSAKTYTDQQIDLMERTMAQYVETKPLAETADKNVWYYYPIVEDGNTVYYQTMYLTTTGENYIEMTMRLGQIDLSAYVSKTLDVTGEFTENPADLTKIPNLQYMGSMRNILLTALGRKVNKTDIIDDLLTENIDKPLSANQGKVLNTSISDVSDRVTALESSIGATFTETSPTINALGGVLAGTIVTGWTDHALLQKALFPYQKPEVSLSINPSTTLYKIGSSVASEDLSAIVTKKTKAITSVKFYKDSTELYSVPSGYENGGTFTHTYNTTPITTNTTFKVICADSDNEVQSTKTIEFINVMYKGLSTDGTLTEVLQKKGTYTYNNITCSNASVIFKYPQSYGNLSSIKDSNNFENLSSFVKTTETIDGISYNVYTSGLANLNSFKYIFSF